MVNVNGGAIGMSGNRITLHLALELARRGGGGQGDAIIIRTIR